MRHSQELWFSAQITSLFSKELVQAALPHHVQFLSPRLFHDDIYSARQRCKYSNFFLFPMQHMLLCSLFGGGYYEKRDHRVKLVKIPEILRRNMRCSP